MAILNEDILKKDISSKKLAKTYLLFGNDSFLKKTYADKIINLSYDGDPFFNLQKFERDCDLQDVYNAVEALNLAGVTVLGVNLYLGEDKVDYIAVPVSKIPQLNHVEFTREVN